MVHVLKNPKQRPVKIIMYIYRYFNGNVHDCLGLFDTVFYFHL